MDQQKCDMEKSLIHTSVNLGTTRQELESLVANGSDWKATDKHGLSTLHFAAAVGNLEATNYFLSLGADVNGRAPDQTTPLHHLCKFAKENFSEILTLLVEAGADVNAVDEKGFNVLIYALQGGKFKEQLEQLIELGCLLKTDNKYGHSILHMAVTQGNLEALSLFISKGANVNERNKFEATPLILTAFAKKNFSEMVKLLVENGAEINAADKSGCNLIFLAVQSATRPTRADIEMLVQLGCDWTRPNNVGYTLLHVAAKDGNVDLLSYFISMKIVPVNARNGGGETPLHAAAVAKQNELEIMNLLLEAGADINAMDKNGIIPLHLAIWQGKGKEELEHMVSSGSDWRKTINDGQTVLHLATSLGTTEALSYFISKGADVNAADTRKRTALHMSVFAKTSFKEKVDLLLKHGADVNERDKDGNNVIFLGTLFGRSKEELEHLLSCGAIWNTRNWDYNSPILHVAVQGDNVDALKLFISLGADVNAMDSLETTPLGRAAAYGKPGGAEIMKELLANGADVRRRDMGAALLFKNTAPF